MTEGIVRRRSLSELHRIHDELRNAATNQREQPDPCDHSVMAYAVIGEPGTALRCRCGEVQVPRASKAENDAYGKACALAATLTALLPADAGQQVTEMLDAVRLETELRTVRRALPELSRIAERLLDLAEKIEQVASAPLLPVGTDAAREVGRAEDAVLAQYARQVADLVLRDGKPRAEGGPTSGPSRRS